jgi:hypothetical protein
MRAFIVRPFGDRPIGVKNLTINFDEVEAKLIRPALEHHGIKGTTTLEIASQNNIRVDMFERLVTADLVIADISIHNANVFYELGIRHALRDKHTLLIRCSLPELEKANKVPFDLLTDRYQIYDRDKPAAGLEKLKEAIGQSLVAENKDSPVFQLLPELEPEDPTKFLAVPGGFTDAVEAAVAARATGDLELLAEEVAGQTWEGPGMRVVGRAQFALRAWEGARATWEKIAKLRQGDLEANLKLPTIYQGLKERVASDQAARRVLALPRGASARERAEAYSLLGSNEKVAWTDSWTNTKEKREAALRSVFLERALEQYRSGFQQDCNHYYSGFNALALWTIRLELARALPAIWAEGFKKAAEAEQELNEQTVECAQLAGAVSWSLRTAGERDRRAGKEPDIWRAITEADVALLTQDNPALVAQQYQAALAGATAMPVNSVRRQLLIYQQLGVMSANVARSLEAIGELHPTPEPVAIQRVLLFTGHRIDEKGRSEPRFPASKEATARAAIGEVVQKEIEEAGGAEKVLGISGGASGGDILFHEICAELGVKTELFLALPQPQYQVASVSPAGPAWVERFRKLCKKVSPRLLSNDEALPAWMGVRKDYGIWQRSNRWILHNALARCGGQNVTLIALWNGKDGDGPGGTADMVKTAEARGAKKWHIDTTELFKLPIPARGKKVVMVRPSARPPVKTPPARQRGSARR